MSMTTTIEWIVYDGTPETLPKNRLTVLACLNKIGVVMGMTINADGWYNGWNYGMEPQIGDMWAPWPEAPKVERHE